MYAVFQGLFLGAFEIPSQIPILYQGEHEFIINPGIKENGISGSRIIYPFYSSYETTQTLSLNEHHTIAPVTNYKKNANFELN